MSDLSKISFKKFIYPKVLTFILRVTRANTLTIRRSMRKRRALAIRLNNILHMKIRYKAQKIASVLRRRRRLNLIKKGKKNFLVLILLHLCMF
jgi:hypothetical protein